MLNLQSARAQQFRAPKEYSFDNEGSYRQYEKDVIKFINWIQDKRVDETSENYKSSLVFFNVWLSGCPYVRYNENVRIESVFSDIPDLRIYYVVGYVKYALQSHSQNSMNDKIRCSVAGLESMLKEYRRDFRADKRNGDIEDLQKIYDQGKLLEWVEERMH